MIIRSTTVALALLVLAGCALDDGSTDTTAQAKVTVSCDKVLEACLAKGDSAAACQQTHDSCAVAPLFFSNQTGERR